MCEMNLEAFQEAISKARGEDLAIPVLYLPQLIGLALGLSKNELKLNLNLALADSFKQRLNI
jgi:heterodisulfide reductase subunit B